MQFAHELIVPEVGFPFKLFLFEGREGHYHREKHWHRSIEIFAVCDGELEFKIDEKTWHLTAGEFMIVNSNEVHEVDSPLPNETIVLQIPLKVFEKYYTGEQFIWFTHEPGRKDARFMELLEELYKTYCEKQCGYDMKMDSIFYHLLYLLVKEYRLTEVEDAFVRKNKNLNKLSAITCLYERELCTGAQSGRSGKNFWLLSDVSCRGCFRSMRESHIRAICRISVWNMQ